jgi:hypothetical protein
MIQKIGAKIVCLNTKHSEYIKNMNSYSRQHNSNLTIFATENDKFYAKGK